MAIYLWWEGIRKSLLTFRECRSITCIHNFQFAKDIPQILLLVFSIMPKTAGAFYCILLIVIHKKCFLLLISAESLNSDEIITRIKWFLYWFYLRSQHTFPCFFFWTYFLCCDVWGLSSLWRVLSFLWQNHSMCRWIWHLQQLMGTFSLFQIPHFRLLLIDMVSYFGHVFKKLAKPLYKWIPLSVYKTFFFKKKSLLDIRKMNYERKQLQCVVSAAVGEIECDQDAWRCAGLPFQIVMWHFPVFTVLLVISHQMAHLLELGTGTVSYILSCVYGSPSL